MKLTIFSEREQIVRKVNFSGKTVNGLLQYLRINPETVLVVRKNKVLTGKEMVKDGDQIELLSVISGG